MFNNSCDGGHLTNMEVRLLPLNKDQGSNLIVCFNHYLEEIKWRKMRNIALGDFAKFDLPTWESLEIYTGE